MTHQTITPYTVGDLIRAERARRRLTQSALASLASISAYTVHNIESGKTDPSFLTLRKLADALSCSLDQLVPPLTPSLRSLMSTARRLVGGGRPIRCPPLQPRGGRLSTGGCPRFSLPGADTPGTKRTARRCQRRAAFRSRPESLLFLRRAAERTPPPGFSALTDSLPVKADRHEQKRPHHAGCTDARDGTTYTDTDREPDAPSRHATL